MNNDPQPQTQQEQQQQPSLIPPLSLLLQNVPDPLPHGWIMHKSRSYPGYAYYFNQFTGERRWDLPMIDENNLQGLKETIQILTQQQLQQGSNEFENGTLQTTLSSVLAETHLANAHATDSKNDNSVHGIIGNGDLQSTMKQKEETDAGQSLSTNASDPRTKKRERSSGENQQSTVTSSPEKKIKKHGDTPEKVRVLHILKKHKDSRRPASWRQAKITISKEEAIAELKEIISILEESKGDAKELRATFEELAKTESDCTSAKRGGDVGYFGRKKMQPNFEKVSFSLGIGEMSGIVETSSGVHVILRLG